MQLFSKNYYKPTTGQNCIADASWVPNLTLLGLMKKLDLTMCSRNRTHPHGGALYVNIKERNILFILYVNAKIPSTFFSITYPFF